MGDSAPIIKNVIHAGQNYKPISDGSKVHFHFQTWKCGKERVLIDDSRKIGQKEPMLLVIGHKFKLEVWESIVKMMAVGEVASFTVTKELVFSYPFVSKTLRELGQDACKRKHACTMTLHTEGIGYADLDNLMKEPCDLEFIIELLRVERSDEYEKEVWQLSSEERLELVPSLREKGNQFYGRKKYDEAEEAYAKAIAICEQLMIRERKCDEEWVNLNKTKLPILLNYAQCKLIKGDYYAVIEHCNTVLEHDKGMYGLSTGIADSRSKLIIDHDGGADDAMAIFMALLHEQYFNGLTVLALTTTYGNVHEGQAFINSQRILDIAGRREVPIYRGSNSSLVISTISDYFFGADGLGDNEHEPIEPILAQPMHAAMGIIELSKKYPGEIKLLAIGSLTNVALAVQLDPTLIDRLSHLYVGAGNVYSELEPNAEFNAEQDVESYHVVVQNANPEKVTILPFSQVKPKNVTRQWRENVLGAIPTKIMRAQNGFERCSIDYHETWTLLDPIAMAAVLNNTIIGDVKYSQNGIILCDNEKALYRRAKAHIGAWNPDLAEEDFLRLGTLNPTMVPSVEKELAHIRKLQKDKQSKDKDALKKMFGTDNGT